MNLDFKNVELHKIFNKYDLMSLEPGDFAPEDEYDVEVKELLEYINKSNLSLDNVYNAIVFVFKKMFGEDLTDITETKQQRLRKMAEEIFEVLKKRYN